MKYYWPDCFQIQSIISSCSLKTSQHMLYYMLLSLNKYIYIHNFISQHSVALISSVGRAIDSLLLHESESTNYNILISNYVIKTIHLFNLITILSFTLNWTMKIEMCPWPGWNSGPLDPRASTLTATPASTRANRAFKIQSINVDLLILI